MEILGITLNTAVAPATGVAIGQERQYRQHPAGLRTNALVCVGAAPFVSLSKLAGDPGSPTRMASYVVSGIGFLGGGVILRDGMNVKGMNTAATLWCGAAAGALSGIGFPLHALIGTATVLGLHLGLRPIAHRIDAARKSALDVETAYRIRVIGPEDREGVLRSILLGHVNSHPRMTIQGISTQESESTGRATIVADIFSVERDDRAMQNLMSRINIEHGVTSVRWEKVHAESGT